MINFKSITTLVTNAVTKYKMRRAHAVVNQYCALMDMQITANAPAVIEFYRSSALAIVDKTFEDPKPALQLVAAVQAVAEHYGPALRTELDVLSAKLEANGASPVFIQRMETLFKAINDLTTDVNDH